MKERPVTILGSCVSRDLLELHPEIGHVAAYIARQSWISAVRPWTPPAIDSGLNSPFQERQIRGDMMGSALPALEEGARSHHRILLDLIDERLGVLATIDGRVVTRSSELLHSAWASDIKNVSFAVDFGSDAHFEAWVESSKVLLGILDTYEATQFTTVLAPDFATRDDQDTPVPRSLGKSATRWNTLYQRYYDHLAAQGLRIVRVPRRLIRTSHTHQWGSAPFHYVDGVYGYLAEQILHPSNGGDTRREMRPKPSGR